MSDDLIKDGSGTTTVGYYKEKLFRKVDTKSDAIVRSMDFAGTRYGKVLVVGINEFVIEEGDGTKLTVSIDSLIDLE